MLEYNTIMFPATFHSLIKPITCCDSLGSVANTWKLYLLIIYIISYILCYVLFMYFLYFCLVLYYKYFTLYFRVGLILVLLFFCYCTLLFTMKVWVYDFYILIWVFTYLPIKKVPLKLNFFTRYVRNNSSGALWIIITRCLKG